MIHPLSFISILKWPLLIRRGTMDKAKAITRLASGGRDGGAVLAAGRVTGEVHLMNPGTGQTLVSLQAAPTSQLGKEDAAVAGLHLVWDHTDAESKEEEESTVPSVLTVTRGGAARLHAPSATTANPAAQEWSVAREWTVPSDVASTAYDPASASLAVACKGTELRVFSVTTGELVYAAKGGRPNMVGLVDKPWNTAVVFLPAVVEDANDAREFGVGGSGGTQGGRDGTESARSSSKSAIPRIVVGTALKKLRMYDPFIGKRPQLDVVFGDGRVTAVAVDPRSGACWAADGAGRVQSIDFVAGKMGAALKGQPAGAVRALASHSELPLLAVAGLDRKARVYETSGRNVVGGVYLKTTLTAAVFLPVDAAAAGHAGEKKVEATEMRKESKGQKRGSGEGDTQKTRHRRRD
jgi:ribosome biogenesis protein NSA1